MRKLVTISALLLLISSVKAQSFMFYRGTQPLEDNAEFTVSDYEVYFEEDDYVVLTFDSDLQLKNVTANDLQTSVTQTILEGPLDNENGYLSFCFFDCVTGNFDRTKSGVMQANSFNQGFSVTFYAFEGKYNRIKVKYEVYLTNDIGKTDKKTVTVTYIYDENSTILSNNLVFKPEFTVFQDGNQLKTLYTNDLNACLLEIYSILGNRIAQHILPSNQVTFSLPETFTKGIYICVLRNKQQVIATQKISVK